MEWDALGAIGELIGALAVVGSLAYLATQVRTSNRLARAEAWRLPNSDLNTINASFSTDPVFRQAMHRAYYERANRAALSDDEAVAIDMYLISIANLYEQIYREIREGILDASAIRDFGAHSMIETPYFRERWFAYRRSLGPSFVSFFEAEFDLAGPESA
jgi:hypothetical protein